MRNSCDSTLHSLICWIKNISATVRPECAPIPAHFYGIVSPPRSPRLRAIRRGTAQFRAIMVGSPRPTGMPSQRKCAMRTVCQNKKRNYCLLLEIRLSSCSIPAIRSNVACFQQNRMVQLFPHDVIVGCHTELRQTQRQLVLGLRSGQHNVVVDLVDQWLQQ